ncbi:hypothetical protein M0805_000731 [Coniferiporia weirii]|nr:hypothetical protein M0805_000731 [Coniferiporia weirii]
MVMLNSDWMTIVLIDYILLMRVFALWSGERKLAVYLKTLFVVESAFMLGFSISMGIKEKVTLGGAEGYVFCGVDGLVPPLFETLYWTAPLVIELILLVLALYKAASLWRESAGFKGVSLVKVLVLDQAFYFAVVMICGVAHITTNWVDQLVTPNAATNIVHAIVNSTTLPCIVGRRLLVHLNEAAEIGVNGGTSYRARSVSDIQFA